MKTTMVVRLQPGHERKVSGAEDEVEEETEGEIIERKHSGTMGLAGGKDKDEEEEADVVGDEKEFEIEIARSEEEVVDEVVEEEEVVEEVVDEEEVIEKFGIENTSDEETAGDSQSIVGIEEEDPLKSDEGSDEDLENKEDAVDEVVHSESDEESGEDLTGKLLHRQFLFVSLFGNVEIGEALTGWCWFAQSHLFACSHPTTPTQTQSVTQVCAKTNRSYYGDRFSYGRPLSVPLTF